MSAPTQPAAEAAHAFVNRLRSLFNIDGHELPELDATARSRFLNNPVHFLMRADDATRDVIWREVERRQVARRAL